MYGVHENLHLLYLQLLNPRQKHKPDVQHKPEFKHKPEFRLLFFCVFDHGPNRVSNAQSDTKMKLFRCLVVDSNICVSLRNISFVRCNC